MILGQGRIVALALPSSIRYQTRVQGLDPASITISFPWAGARSGIASAGKNRSGLAHDRTDAPDQPSCATLDWSTCRS